MTIEVDEFANYIGEDMDGDRQAELNRSLLVAATLIDAALEQAWRPCPEVLRDQMVLDVARDVFKRSENSNGQYDDPNVRLAPSDPLLRVRTLLNRYVMGL